MFTGLARGFRILAKAEFNFLSARYNWQFPTQDVVKRSDCEGAHVLPSIAEINKLTEHNYSLIHMTKDCVGYQSHVAF